MESRLDMIVIGATGFTGKHVVRKIADLIQDSEYADLSWGISGRSMEKLQKLLAELAEKGIETSKIPVIQCDIKEEGTLTNVTRRARVLINVTGPNTVLSEPVVRACIETGTHYLDISAELFHMLNLYRKYSKQAEQANVLVIPACGLASIPVAAGLMHLEKNFKGHLRSAECYFELGIPKRTYVPVPCYDQCLLNYGTWESLVYELKNLKTYYEQKNEVYSEPEPLPEDLQRSFFHRHNGSLWYPYPGPDKEIVNFGQNFLQKTKGKKPYHFSIYSTMPMWFHFIIIPAIYLYYYLCKFGCFANLLWKYPRVFSFGYVTRKGPSQKTMDEMTYSFTLIGKGWSEKGDVDTVQNKTLTVKVSGNDPGYGTTATAIVCSAISVVREYSGMPKGGVIPLGAAFYDTKLIQRLTYKNGMKFDIEENVK